MSHAPPQPMLLQLLAQPRLLRNGEPVHVGSRKALAILGLLALDGSSTRARLTSLLWPEVDAAAGRRNLRRELFRLRELGLRLFESVDGALALDAGVEVDALALLADGPLPESAGLPLEGLDGVGGIELDAWLQRWRDQLAEHQSQALDRHATACEGRGELAAALAWRQRGLAADPLNEASASHVVRLKAELGDRVGALQAYQRYADALREDLDIAPSPAAQALASSLRQGAGEGAAVSGTAPPTPLDASDSGASSSGAGPGLPTLVPFVPRAAAQQRIESAWARGQRVYLHGPAGAGKTRLASELAAARGPWLRVACEPQDAELPYSSVVRLLRALRESAPDVELPDWVRRELAQLMPELGEPPRALATDEARQRLLAAAAEAWRLLMHDNFSAFVLDDWQWGDSASVELWSRLDDTALAADASVAWIISYRSAQLLPSALERQRADIDNRRAVAVALEGMDESEVLTLTQALSGAAGGRLFSQRLHDATDGNPFFLLETLRHLFEQRLLVADASGWSTPFDAFTESYAELPVPASVRAAVLARARALGAPAQRLLEVASLCAGDIDASLLAAASGIDEERVVASLEHAQAAQLVGEDQGHWRFAHDLVRQSLAQGLSAARRRLLHDRLASQLERTRAAPSIIAAHWEAAERRHEALPWRVAAAESAVRLHALGDALSHYAQALADGASGAAASRIHRAMAHIHARRADRAAAEAAFEAAIEAASGDALEGAAEALQGLLDRADHFRRTDRVAEAMALLDSLHPDLAQAPPPQRAQALAARGSAMVAEGRHNEGLRLFLQAV
ncbi:MAG: AAA family ATPase, partial [Caldimonas sp.]